MADPIIRLPPPELFSRKPDVVVDYCPHCGAKQGYTSEGQADDGKRLYRCRACLDVFKER